MAMQTRILQSFSGVRQDKNDYISSPDTSPNACNMNTLDGCLSVAKGFSRAVPLAVPAPQGDYLKRLYVYARPDGLRYLVCTDTRLLVWSEDDAEWKTLFRFGFRIDANQVDFLPIKIGSDDQLLIAYGREQLLKWDGQSSAAAYFGSSEQKSNAAQNYLEQYFGRLFAAGNPDASCRLFWSKTPGDSRTVEDWRVDDASPDVSGGFVDVGTDSDPITGLFALSNQLLIFKRDTLYRLLGDRPSNYRVLSVDAAFSRPLHTACVRYADRLYFLTKTGLCCFDGQTVRRPSGFRALHQLLEASDLDHCMAAASGDILYFAIRENLQSAYNDVLIEYDLMRGTFMIRRGFQIGGLCAARGELYVLTGAGLVERFDDSVTYDGWPIEAWWETPRIDFGSKSHDKALGELSCTGTGDPMKITVKCDGRNYDSVLTFPDEDDSAAEAVLRGEGRVIRLRFSNIDGGHFTLDTGVTVRFDAQLRPE